MRRLHTLLLVCLASTAARAAIPFGSSPSWSSNDNDYSTGGAFADVDTNGFLDLCVSNGNDMALDRNAVYLNRGGAFETVASWRSNDAGYFGHCYVGDIDNDGMEDLAVSYLGAGSAGDFLARVYLNSGAGFAPTPSWRAGDRHSSFDCCLGDVDLDGDLDLAISAGDAYSGEVDSARIYRNNAGTLDTLPGWTAGNGVASDAIRFCDIDNDGDPDLFVGQRRRISMYRNNAGVLETTPSWVATRNVGWCLRLAFADYDLDGFLDLAAACNDQLGDPNSIKVFRNLGGTLDTVARFNMLRVGSNLYSSCVAWADVNDDGYPDLAAGGWWRPVVVFENRAGVLDTVPTWSWSPSNRYNLVCEALVWGDVDNSHVVPWRLAVTGNGRTRLFTIRRTGPLESLDSVRVNGAVVPRAGYCFDRLGAWVSFANPPPGGSDVEFFGRVSTHPDLVVTNWDRPNGNHLFLNTTPVGVAAPSRSTACGPRLLARPNPTRGAAVIHFVPRSFGPSTLLRIFDAAGRCIISSSFDHRTLSFPVDLGPCPPGVYIGRTDDGYELKLVRASR